MIRPVLIGDYEQKIWLCRDIKNSEVNCTNFTPAGETGLKVLPCGLRFAVRCQRILTCHQCGYYSENMNSAVP